jgi:hypothetical protein
MVLCLGGYGVDEAVDWKPTLVDLTEETHSREAPEYMVSIRRVSEGYSSYALGYPGIVG